MVLQRAVEDKHRDNLVNKTLQGYHYCIIVINNQVNLSTTYNGLRFRWRRMLCTVVLTCYFALSLIPDVEGWHTAANVSLRQCRYMTRLGQPTGFVAAKCRCATITACSIFSATQPVIGAMLHCSIFYESGIFRFIYFVVK